MTYSNTKFQRIGGNGGPNGTQIFLYGPVGASGTQTDAKATVQAAGYISDGGVGAQPNFGARVGDLVIVVDTSTPLVSWNRVSAVSATGGLTLVN